MQRGGSRRLAWSVKYWSAPREWAGATVFLVAGGPSVLSQDLSLLRGRKVIAVNSSWDRVPFADFLFFGDSRWWYQNHPFIKAFAGRIVTVATGANDPRVLHMRKAKPPPGMADPPDTVAMQYTSLQGAMNLALHLGAARLVLLGADAQPATDGRTHHHKPHQWPQKADCWDRQMENLAHAVKPLKRRKVPVINTCLTSRLPWWPKMSLEEALGCPPPAVLSETVPTITTASLSPA